MSNQVNTPTSSTKTVSQVSTEPAEKTTQLNVASSGVKVQVNSPGSEAPVKQVIYTGMAGSKYICNECKTVSMMPTGADERDAKCECQKDGGSTKHTRIGRDGKPVSVAKKA